MPIGKILKAALPIAGMAAGGYLGGPFGAQLGYAGGSMWGNAFGPGRDWSTDDYYSALAANQQYNTEERKAAQYFAATEAGKDRQLSREFAQQGVRWRVADAAAAGVHPLYALGGSAAAYSPPSVSVAGGSVSAPAFEGSQNARRAVSATATGYDRNWRRMAELRLERGGLENELLRSQIAREQAQLGPPQPSSDPALIEGQGDTPVIDEPMRRTGTGPKASQEPGAVSDVGFARTSTGYAPVPSRDVKERIEDNLISEAMWSIRNLLLPNLGKGDPPPKSWKYPGTVWKWNSRKQEWQMGYPGKRLKPVHVRKTKRKFSGKPVRGRLRQPYIGKWRN